MIWQTSGLPTQPKAGCMPRHVRRAAERLGKDYDKSPKAEVQSFAQALSSSEASSSKTKGKASAKAPHLLRQLTSQKNQTSIVIY